MDDERALRIQKYKEERRKQLTARTATLFSANVTERRRRPDRTPSGDVTLKSSSEANLNTSPSVSIRTTRTSRLRAAANQADISPRNTLKSSSVQNLLDNERTKPSKIIEKDKRTRRQSSKKENVDLKSPSTTCFSDTGVTKFKHSTNLDKKLVSPKDEKKTIGIDIQSDKGIVKNKDTKLPSPKSNDNQVINIIDNVLNVEEEEESNKSLDDKGIAVLKLKASKVIVDNGAQINQVSHEIIPENLDSVVPNHGGLLDVVCVRKVERFSELLSNLCSPSQVDVLFDDLLAENGIEDGSERISECSQPCRRVQPTPRSSGSGVPKRTPAQPATSNDVTGAVTKTKPRRSFEASPPKTETALPSSRASPKNSFILPIGIKSPPSIKGSERRRSSENGTKPSLIPLSKKTADNHIHISTSLKQDSNKLPVKVDTPRSRLESPRTKTQRVSPDKSKSDSETRNNRRHRPQKECEKYQYLSKRLNSLKSSFPEEKNKNSSVSPTEVKTVDKLDQINMSTLHEPVLRPHTSRLSQEVDSVAEFTKRTLDRVNKLTNNISNKSNIDTCQSNLDSLLASNSDQNIDHSYNYGLTDDKPAYRGVSERLNDIDMAAQRLIDFEKQSAMFSDLNNDSSSQNLRLDAPSLPSIHTPISILKRKSINEENTVHSSPNHAVPSPPVTFSPSVMDQHNRSDKRQGILKKRRSLDESQVARRRSCSPEVSFAENESPDPNRSILKNRRSSLEDIVRNRSPDGQIHGILKRKMSKEDVLNDDLSHGSPEPHGILKRKSNSSSASSTATSSHVSIAQAVLLAAAGGAEIVDEDKDTVRPILKKKSFSEERPCLEVLTADTPKPILKKKSTDDEYDTDLPKKPILKTYKRLSGDEGPSSSFEMSEDDRSSRRPSLLRSRTSDHSGSECEATVKPILKQRGSSLTRECSQSPRPRLSFCADNDAIVSEANFSCGLNELSAAGPRRVLGTNPEDRSESFHPSVVLRRRNLRPKSSHRSKSLAGGDVNNELLLILNSRRLKVDKNCENGKCIQLEPLRFSTEEEPAKEFPSVASRIRNMEQALSSTRLESPKLKSRDRDRYKTQPITVDEMRSITSCLELSQAGLEVFGSAACSFPSGFAEAGTSARPFAGEPEKDPFVEFKTLESPIYVNSVNKEEPRAREDSFGEATFLDFENLTAGRKHSTLDEIEQAVNKVRVALDEDSRALDEDDRQAEADNWSLNVSCDSGVYNRASSRDSGPHSGEELGLIESQEIKDNHATNSSNNEWSSSSIETGFIIMDRKRKSTEVEARSPDHSDDEGSAGSGFALGLVKSNSVVARASMWQQLQQQQAKGPSKPPLRHSRSKAKDTSLLADRFKTQPVSFASSDNEEKPQKQFSLAQSKSSANVLDRDEDAKLDEDDPAKMSIFEKMKLFNSKLTHKPPVAGLPRPKEDRSSRTNRLKTMPVLASQVQEAMEQNERLTKSMTHEEVPRNPDFKLKMELFRSASAKNTSLEFLMKQDPKFRSLDMDDESPPRNDSIIAPEVRGILKTSTTVLPKPKTLVKGESSEGLKDEGIDSSSDESASASSESSLEKSCSSSDSSDDIPGPKQRRYQRKNHKIKSSRTDSDLTRMQDPYPRKIIPGANVQMPGAIELKQRFSQNERPLLGKLGKRPSLDKKEDNEELNRYRRPVKKLEEPIQLAKLRRSTDKTSTPVTIEKQPLLKISAMNQEAKNKFFGITPPVPPPPKGFGVTSLPPKEFGVTSPPPREFGVTSPPPREFGVTSPPPREFGVTSPPPRRFGITSPSQRGIGVTSPTPRGFGVTSPPPRGFGVTSPPKELTVQEELIERVRKYIPQPICKSISTHTMELITPGSGSDGESSGGREVRRINTRGRNRLGGGVQRSATHAEMPHRGGTIAERLAALQAAGANDWRARVCRLSPEKDDSKAIERVKNKINESLNAAVDDTKKVQIDENELGSNILADRRTKLETAAQGWRKRVPQTDATQFTVAGRLERDKVATGTPPVTPPPTVISAPVYLPLPATPSSPGIPQANKFRSRKQNTSPIKNGFASGPLRSASCAVVSAAAAEPKTVEPAITKTPKIDRDAFKRSHSISESISRLDEKDESPGAEKAGCPVRVPRADDETFQAFYTPAIPQENKVSEDIDVDLDAIDVSSRQLLSSECARRAKRERRHVASRNPLKALAARTDLREEYSPPPSTAIKEQLIKERATANVGLAAEALAALASKEDFSNVSLRNAAVTPTPIPANGLKQLMLLHVKGRRRVQTRLVEPVHTSVNRGDSFILVTPDQVFLYIGFYANVIEKNRSTDIALHIHNTKDLGCKNSTSVIKIDEQTKNYTKKHWNQFWTLLGVKDVVEDYKPVETGLAEEDEIYESCIVQTNMCYEVQDDELVPIKEYWGQQPKISMLHQSKTIVFDFGSEMYIWYGKNVPLESRRRAAQLAQELFDEGYNYQECHVNPINAASNQGARTEIIATEKTSKKRPEWAVLSKITQHMETILFKEKFLDWPDYTRVIKVKPQEENKINTNEINPCDAEEMWSNEYQEPDLILEGSHLGRGTHYYDKDTMRNFDIKTKSLAKWVIQEFDFQKVENEAEVPEFFAGDSYIIRWEYQITVSGRELNGKPSKHNLTGRDRCAYFCWQGKDASSNEKGAAALLTVELDREKGPQVRVAQGSEPTAFLNLFKGNLIIHQGKKDSDKSRYKLFVTRGNVSNEAYLLQVPCSVRQLRSRGSLLLVDTEKDCLYIWHGSRSLKHTKNIAIELANKLIARKSNYLFGGKNMKITEVKEGEESKEVLEALGVANKQYYNSVLGGGRELEVDVNVTPRLFHFSDLGGQFEAHEVLSPLRHQTLVTPFPFEQKELYTASQPALFLLDDGVSVWIWQGWWPRGEDGELEPAERSAGVGAFASRWQSLRAAALRTAEAYWRVSRKTRPDVRVVTAGLEPRAFTELFDYWAEDDDAAEVNIAHGYKAGEVLSGACELSRLTSCDAILPLAALQRRPLPDHVDPHHLERHLSSPDFLEAFGMTKDEFSVLPAWKQTNLKKDVGLF